MAKFVRDRGANQPTAMLEVPLKDGELVRGIEDYIDCGRIEDAFPTLSDDHRAFIKTTLDSNAWIPTEAQT